MRIKYEVMVHLANTAGNHPDLPGKVIPFDCMPAVGDRICLSSFNRIKLIQKVVEYIPVEYFESEKGLNRRRTEYGTFIDEDEQIEVTNIVRVDEVLYDEKGKPHLFVYNV